MRFELSRPLALALFAIAFAPPAFAGGDVERGRELVTKKYQCGACHGANFNEPIDPSYPKLAGQHPDYLAHALTAYKDNTNAAIGRTNPVMDAQAAQLSSSEIKDIAAYIGSLPGTIETHK